ncbi:MAG: hypothetical protein RLZZ526_1368, partial [Actinomycetota bacterium]
QMRADRRRRRVADMEWFELLYRVYITALIGGFLLLWLSSLVTDAPFTPGQFDTLIHDGPRVVGFLMSVVWFLGMRSGANGGPLSVEEAEVRHVLLAPVNRAAVLRHPAVQRLRTLAFAGTLAGGVTGLVLSKRVPEEWGHGPNQWIICGAVAGSLIGASFVVAALLVHSLRIDRRIVTVTATAIVAWHAASVFLGAHPWAPFNEFGDFMLVISQVSNLIAIAALVLLAMVAVWRAGHLSIEALARRSALVSQLKFAVTLQDIRTVVLLRRQLSQEHMRQTPWFTVPPALRRNIVVTRCLRSLAHFPARRLARMVLLAVTSAVCLVAVWRGTTPALVVSGLALFLLGLDVIEPLSQEVDQPDRTDALPVERGLLLTQHLLVPALTTIPFVVVGVAAAYVMEPHGMTIVTGALIGIPAALAGVAGAVINAVKGAPDPLSESNSGLYMPPEVSGMTTVVRAAWPPVVAIIGSTPSVALVRASENGDNIPAALVRTALGVGLVCFLTAGWVRQRENIRAAFRNFANPQNASSAPTSTQKV